MLKTASGSPLLVELKDGDTYNGRLVSCDAWMNMNLRDVICTSKDGERFWKLPTCYIRGSAVKYLRLPPDLLQKAQEEERTQQESYHQQQQQQQAGGRGRYVLLTVYSSNDFLLCAYSNGNVLFFRTVSPVNLQVQFGCII